MPALQAQSPEFKLKSHKKKKVNSFFLGFELRASRLLGRHSCHLSHSASPKFFFKKKSAYFS
jgi:hypothetical protein